MKKILGLLIALVFSASVSAQINAQTLVQPAQGGTGRANTNGVTLTIPAVSGTACASGNACTATSFTPSTTSGIIGTTTNDSAAAGSVGEYIESVVAAVSFPATGTFGDLTSISLTAGDWDVTGILNADGTGVVTSAIVVGISTTTGNSQTGLVNGSNRLDQVGPVAGTDNTSAAVPAYRMQFTTTTTVYLKFFASFPGTAPKASGRLSARRIR